MPEIVMEVELVLSQRTAKVWRKPDVSFPQGRAHALQLSRYAGDKVLVEGDLVLALVDETTGDIESARFASRGV